MVTYGAEFILTNISSVTGVLDIELQRGETAWNPASTKRTIKGPRGVKYLRHADGGIDAHVTR